MLDADLVGGGAAQDTIYLCNFRVSVDGEWLCLKQLEDVEVRVQEPPVELRSPSPEPPLFVGRCDTCDQYFYFLILLPHKMIDQ